MKSPYVNEVEPNQTITGVFLVAFKEIRQKKAGEPYLSLILADRTGDLEAKMWDNASEVMDTFDKDHFIRVKGMIQVHHNRPQLSIHKLQPVVEAEVDITDFLPASKRDRNEMFRELQGWIAGFTNPYLKPLLESIFADEKIALQYRTAPAAKTVHHAWVGGLIEHVLSLARLAKFTGEHYADIDMDLLLAGVFLHDIGKITELTYARSLGYSDEGQLLGHIVIGVQMVDEKIRQIPGFPVKLRELLLHMILSHHGQMDFGSPKVPVFPEAMLLHLLDNMDSKMESMRGITERDRQVEGNWTGYNSALERSVLKKAKYLDPNVAPIQSSIQVSPSNLVPPTPKPSKRPEPSSSPFAAKLNEALQRDN
jgi:3'-5' exoribonuclease